MIALDLYFRDHLDAYAANHEGLAPIVVVADQLGTPTANPLCLDSALGKSETYLARDLAVAAAAVSRAAKELHEDLSTPIDEVIEEARSQQAAKVAALEAELEAAKKALADLD